MKTRSCRNRWIAFLFAAMLASASNARRLSALDPVDSSKLEGQIRAGHAESVLKVVEDGLAREPDNWLANTLRVDALLALGRADEAEAGLIRWADRDRTDATRADQLVRFYKTTKRWDSAAGTTPRLAALPNPQRTEELRSLVDTLCEGETCALAIAPVRQLLHGAADRSIEAVMRALTAATATDAKGMIAEIPAFPAAEDSEAARTEAFVLVSQRAARAIRVEEGNPKSGPSLPPTGGKSPDSLSVEPVLVRKVSPDYPEVAKRARIAGKVILRALILPSGEAIVTGTYSETNPMFLYPAAEAVAQWRYEPGRLDGVAVATDYAIKVEFDLRPPS